MKKTILISIIIIFSLVIVKKCEASGENCAKYGGTCNLNKCDSTQYIGLLDCPNSVPYCCGNASAAQQQMLGGSSNTASGNTSNGFINPLGTNTIEGVLGNIMNYLRGIAGTIAVIFIIIGGVMYMVSSGDKDMTERAKKTVIYACIGLAIVLAAPLFYQEIKAVLSGNNPGSAFQALLLNVLKLLLAIVGFLAIIMMVIGGIWMLTATGNEERYELGKKTATYSILGLVIAVAALIIAQQVTILVGGSGVITPSTSTSNSAANSTVAPSNNTSNSTPNSTTAPTNSTEAPPSNNSTNAVPALPNAM
jgi:type IV secretory pathway VirB2 component (pilin)